MQVIVKDFFDCDYTTTLPITPLFDTHVGAAACDEKALRRLVAQIQAEPGRMVIGGGDYGDFINRRDPRYDPSTVAPWLQNEKDMAAAQRDRIEDILAPIADRFLCLLGGNHESSILRFYERDIYGSIVNRLKARAGLDPETKLALGYEGWLVLRFYRSNKRERGAQVTIRLHHGYGGGRLDGAPALEMQCILQQNDCDLALHGHIHKRHIANPVVIEGLSRSPAPRRLLQIRKGAYCGTFLDTRLENGPSTYSAVKGYPSTSLGTVDVTLRPFAENPDDVVKIAA